MGLEKHYGMNINQLVKSKFFSQRLGKRKSYQVFGRNQLLWDLGLDVFDMSKKDKIKEKIKSLDNEFDLVLIAERFDESLLLLQNLLCWKISDMSYLKLNERVAKSKTKMSFETRKILKNWLWADFLLYDHFKTKLDSILNNLSRQEFQSRLTSFHFENAQVFADCVIVKGDNKFLRGKFKMALPIVLGYVTDENKPGCEDYAISEPNFAMMLHDKQNKGPG